jgi:cell division septation protein DedD
VTRRWPLLLLLAACARSGDRDTPKSTAAQDASADGTRAVSVVALRLPANGGTLRAYALPGLAPLPWPIAGRSSPARGVVGMDVAGRRLLFRDTVGAIAAFDLVAQHERTVAPRGTLAAMAAHGVLLAVDRRGAVVESQPWGSRSWPDTLGGGVHEVFAAPGPRLLLVRGNAAESLVAVSRDGGIAFAAATPSASDRTATRDGDAVAFATDSGVVVLEDREARVPWFVRLSGTPRAVAFSPSGHRLYVALRARGELAVVDRFARAEHGSIPLPGPAAALRGDPWGRVLFVRPADTALARAETWVVGVAAGRLLGRLATEWDTDLPTVSPGGVVLAREGDAVVTREVHSLDSLGAVPDGAADYWFVGAWAPSGAAAAIRQQARVADVASPTPRQSAAPAPAAAAPATALADAKATPPAAAPARRLWVQVSVSQSEPASRDLAASLVAARHPAQVVPPRGEGDGWRVVVGPFTTRDEAEAAGRSLGRPFFIVERDLPTPQRP